MRHERTTQRSKQLPRLVRACVVDLLSPPLNERTHGHDGRGLFFVFFFLGDDHDGDHDVSRPRFAFAGQRSTDENL